MVSTHFHLNTPDMCTELAGSELVPVTPKRTRAALKARVTQQKAQLAAQRVQGLLSALLRVCSWTQLHACHGHPQALAPDSLPTPLLHSLFCLCSKLKAAPWRFLAGGVWAGEVGGWLGAGKPWGTRSSAALEGTVPLTFPRCMSKDSGKRESHVEIFVTAKV